MRWFPPLLVALVCSWATPAHALGISGRVVDWEGRAVGNTRVAIGYDGQADQFQSFGRFQPTDVTPTTNEEGEFSCEIGYSFFRNDREISALVLTEKLFGASQCRFRSLEGGVRISVVCVPRLDLCGVVVDGAGKPLTNRPFTYEVGEIPPVGRSGAVMRIMDGATDSEGRFRIAVGAPSCLVRFYVDRDKSRGFNWLLKSDRLALFSDVQATVVVRAQGEEQPRLRLDQRYMGIEHVFSFDAERRFIRELGVASDIADSIALPPDAKELLFLSSPIRSGPIAVDRYCWLRVPDDLSNRVKLTFLPIGESGASVRVIAPPATFPNDRLQVCLAISSGGVAYTSYCFSGADRSTLFVPLVPGLSAFRAEVVYGRGGTNLDSDDVPALPELYPGTAAELKFRSTVATHVRLVDAGGRPLGGQWLDYTYKNQDLGQRAWPLVVEGENGARENFRPDEEIVVYYLGREIPARTPHEDGATLTIVMGERTAQPK